MIKSWIYRILKYNVMGGMAFFAVQPIVYGVINSRSGYEFVSFFGGRLPGKSPFL